MAATSDLLLDAFGRIQEVVHQVVEGLTLEQLTARVDPEANTIAWLIWHLTRIQDDHVAGVAGSEQIWTSRGWHERFDLPFTVRSTGYGHSSEEVAAVKADADLLLGYYDEVHNETVRYVSGLGDDELDRIVDERWDPPVTLAVRLMSVISDDLQHAGQAAFIRGILSHP